MNKTTNKFIKGTIILSAAGILSKILGMIFRIPLSNKIGKVGMGYYQLPYPIYTLLISISYIGIPSAISKLVSEKIVDKKYNEADKIFKYALTILLFIGLFISALLFVSADALINMFNWSEEVKYSIWGLSLAPLFVSIMGAFRGYFQGMQNMIPTSVSQIAESTFRVVIGLSLAYLLANMNIGYAAGGASFGATAGAMAGCIFMGIYYLRYKKKMKKEGCIIDEKSNITFKMILKQIITIAFPITLGASIGSVISLIDSAIIVNRLVESGVSKMNADAMFGQFSGQARTILNVPLTLSMAMVLSTLPAISEAVKKENVKELYEKITTAIKFVLYIGLPAAVGMAVMSNQIFDLLFKDNFEPGVTVTNTNGAMILTVLSGALIFIMLGQLLTAILQGMGHFYLPIINLAIGAVIKGILDYILVYTTLHVKGAAIASICAYLVYTVLNYIYIKKYSGYRLKSIFIILKPLLSSIVMGFVAMSTYKMFININISGKIATLMSICVAGCIYIIMLFLTGALKVSDVQKYIRTYKLSRKKA